MFQGRTGKIQCLGSEKMAIFHIQPYFSTYPFKTYGTPTHLEITFRKSTKLELSLYKALL